ncbi:RNA polymerase sigma factor [Planctomycetes bacterium Poly30]|uniref:RNA polymerase sigma factor n=1 Tax=Saltatorellus ferox TaxID=2528018 RepID=A0A518EVT1_9BACT|nr:RNA polymerase sigma factor [Planctomycetes bacterium Poly30]
METEGELLTELAWLRRVAAGLVGDDAAASDLTQDVALEALRRPPMAEGASLEGARLRGWLWTVARRKARRGREQRAASSLAEENASQAERVEGPDRSARQLALHRDLLAEIHALGGADADLIVQRYLDQRPPREIALALDLPVPTVRKRLSRAMGRLRARLVESERGSGGWSLGLCVILGSGSAPGRAPVSESASATGRADADSTALRSAGSGGAWKLAALALGFLAVGASWLLLVDPRDPSASTLPEPVTLAARDAEAPGVLLLAPPASNPDADPRTAVESPPADATLASESPLDVAPRSRVFFVDEAGAPVLGARAIWADEDSTPHVMEIDDAGVALLPTDARGWIYAGADGFENGDHAIAWSDSDDINVELRRQREIQGQLLIDGVVPGSEITLFRDRGSNHPPLSASNDERLKAALIEHGLEWPRTRIKTDRGGAFIFTTLASSGDYFLQVPYDIPLVDAEGVLRHGPHTVWFARETSGLQLMATRVDSVEGKIVWSDDQEPVTERFDFFPCDEEGEWLAQLSVATDANGEFSLPLRVAAHYRSGEEVAWSRWELHLEQTELFGRLSGSEGSRSLPLIEVPRGSMKRFRVVGRSSEGVKPLLAVLASATEVAETRSDGTASLHASDGSSVRVMARGYQARVAEVDPSATSADAPQTIELEAAPRLRVRFPLEHRIGFDPDRSVRLVLRMAPTAFAGCGEIEEEQESFWRLCRRLCGTTFRGFRSDDDETPTGPGSAYFQGLPNRDLWIDGLRPGVALLIELHDQFGQVLASQPATMPPAGGEPVLTLDFEDPYATGAAALRGTCRWPSDGRPYRGQVQLYRDDHGRVENTRASASGEFAMGPLVPGRYFIVARMNGSTPQRGEGVDVVIVPGMNTLTIDAIGPEPD